MEISQSTALHIDRPGDAMIDGARLGARPPVNPLQLTTEEGTRLLRIISRAALINRHQDIYLWLAGELQQFLPHQILVSAWGDFARGKLSFDVASGIPGVRTSHLARCRIDEFVRECHRHWLASALQQHQQLHNRRARRNHDGRQQRTGADQCGSWQSHDCGARHAER